MAIINPQKQYWLNLWPVLKSCMLQIDPLRLTQSDKKNIVGKGETRAITERGHTPHQRIIIEQVLVTKWRMV